MINHQNIEGRRWTILNKKISRERDAKYKTVIPVENYSNAVKWCIEHDYEYYSWSTTYGADFIGFVFYDKDVQLLFTLKWA